MKYRINLYSSDLRPKRLWLSLSHLCLVVSAVLLLLLAIGAMLSSRLHSQMMANQALVLTQQQLQLEQDRLQGELNLRRSDLGLQKEYQLSQDELSSRQQLLEALRGRAPLRSAGYAAVLEDLARIHSAEIALQQIDLQQEQMSFRGQARSTQSVPAWVQRFASAPALKGRAFGELQLNRGAGGELLFRLNSTAVEVSKAPGDKS